MPSRRPLHHWGRAVNLPDRLKNFAYDEDAKSLRWEAAVEIERLWTVADGELVQTLEEHSGVVSSVAF